MKKFLWLVAVALIWVALTDSDENRDTNQNSSVTVNQTTAAQLDETTSQKTPKVKIDTATYMFVTGNRVRIRNGPGTDNPVMGHLDRGDRVRVQGNNSGWSEVVTSFGRGWMSSNYLSSKQPSVTASPTPKRSRQVAVPTTSEIREARAAIILQSIASYPGSCPCPYNRDRAGRRCGGRSAWSRPGGYSPICYENDVSDARLQSYFARRR